MRQNPGCCHVLLPLPPRTKKGALGRGSPDDVDDVICALDQPLAN